MLPLTLLLRNVGWKNVGLVTLAAGVFLLLDYSYLQHVELEKTALVYRNPERRTITKTIRTEGPVRIVTRIVERPTGEKETVIEETRGAVVETTAAATEEKPVPLAIAMAPPRTDRWLVGATLLDFSPAEAKNYRLNAGYSWRNAVDVLAGAGADNGFTSSLQVVLRF